MSGFPTEPGSRFSMTIAYPANSSLPTGGGYTSNSRRFFRPRYTFALGWNYKTRSGAEAFMASIVQQTGGVFSFPFTTWFPLWWRRAQVGTGDGSAVVFDFPAVGSVDQQLFTRGTLLGANVTHGGGTNGSDLVTLFSPPDLYAPISADFFGKRIFTVCYANDGEPRIARHLETGRYMVDTTLTTDRGNGVRT